MKLKSVLDEKRKKRLALPGKKGFAKNMIVFSPTPRRSAHPHPHPHLLMRKKLAGGGEGKPEAAQYDSETYVLYRSKNRIMPAAHDVYDVGAARRGDA